MGEMYLKVQGRRERENMCLEGENVFEPVQNKKVSLKDEE